MLTYLASIEKRKQLQSPGKLQLLALKGANNLWVRANQEPLVDFTKDRSGFLEGVLVLVTLSEKRVVLSMEYAQDEILRGLVSTELKRQWDEVAVWRSSLEFQRIEVEKRRIALEKREAECEELGMLLKSQQEIVAEVFNNLSLDPKPL